MVDVGIHSEDPFEDRLDDLVEGFRKGNTNLAGEYGFVVELSLNPSHQQIDVFRCWHFERCPDVLSIGP